MLSDIFGKDCGPIYEKGLIDCTSTFDFHKKKLMDLKSTWDCLVPEFHSWFVKYEADLFKTNLIKEVTNLAQIDGRFSNNRTESVNNNVKDWLGRSGSLNLAVVNRKIEEYVKAQQQEMEMTIYSNGPYELVQSHQYLRKDRHIWNAMSTDER